MASLPGVECKARGAARSPRREDLSFLKRARPTTPTGVSASLKIKPTPKLTPAKISTKGATTDLARGESSSARAAVAGLWAPAALNAKPKSVSTNTIRSNRAPVYTTKQTLSHVQRKGEIGDGDDVVGVDDDVVGVGDVVVGVGVREYYGLPNLGVRECRRHP